MAVSRSSMSFFNGSLWFSSWFNLLWSNYYDLVCAPTVRIPQQRHRAAKENKANEVFLEIMLKKAHYITLIKEIIIELQKQWKEFLIQS